MKRIFLFLGLSVATFFVLMSSFLEIRTMDKIAQSVDAIILIMLMVPIVIDFLSKDKKEEIYYKVVVIQNALFLSFLVMMVVLQDVTQNFYSEFSIILSVSVFLITALTYILEYRNVNKNDRLKEILNLKQDTVIKNLYDFYYLTVGILMVAIMFAVILTFMVVVESLILITVLTLIVNILQIYFLKIIFIKK